MPESIKERAHLIPDRLTEQELRPLLVAILDDLTALRTALNTHTHGGVTTGAGTTGVANAGTAPALNLQA